MGTRDNAGIINLINKTFAKTFAEEAAKNSGPKEIPFV